MPEADEYDAFYSPIDPEFLVDLETAAITAQNSRESAPSPTANSNQQSQVEPPTPSSSDEFDSYDFSEFTAQDFEHIDAMVLAHVQKNSTPPAMSPYHQSGTTRGYTPHVGAVGSGGPRVEIDFEGAKGADSRRLLKGIKFNAPGRRTPFEQFRRWNILSVTDLVGPSWCEVQFDYGLRQQRYKKLEDRPSSFVTSEGKTITVVQDVATENDRTAARGKSVHKVLEREVQPETVSVEITSPEERWALRLREMPVFGIVHNQVVTGIIDEIVRRPTTMDESAASQAAGTSSPNKRAAPSGLPATPVHLSSKRTKHATPADQPQITAFFPSGRQDGTHGRPVRDVGQYILHLSDTKTRTRPSLPPDEDTFASRIQLMLYHRLLSSLFSYATPRVHASEPLNLSVLWRRVGVNPSRRFSDSFIAQAGLAPPSSSQGDDLSSKQSCLTGLNCLNDLATAWKHTVEALNVSEIDTGLTLVYREQIRRSRFGNKQKTTEDTSQSAQEEADLAAAIQASVSDLDAGTGGDEGLARAIYESLKDSLKSSHWTQGPSDISIHPFGAPFSAKPYLATLETTVHSPHATMVNSETASHDPPITESLEESLSRGCIREGHASGTGTHYPTGERGRTVVPDDGNKTAPASPAKADELVEAEESMTVAELNVEARIIGTKQFQLDNRLLDNYLTRVLQWWYGQRPPEGVDVELTRRCRTCEYREGCEWREKKAQEAIERYRSRSASSADPAAA
ncbi:exonuclease V [Trametes elegans]|nr:exonuclease V [Trametes elegans]